MSRKISRFRRAQIQSRAQQIRHQAQLAGWSAARIADAILRDLPDVLPLEAWRLAYGWSRPHVVASIADAYRHAGLEVPGVNSSMLCRWEHGHAEPGIQYGQVLSRLYGARPDQLGLSTPSSIVSLPSKHDSNTQDPGENARVDHEDGDGRSSGETMTLAAVGESILLALEIEGASGGPFTRDQIDRAVQYYGINYTMFPTSLLAAEVNRCRAMVSAQLRHAQPVGARTELRRLAGWLSALLGNLAFHGADYIAANIHLSVAARLGADIGHGRLTAWALGACSMLARYQHHPGQALNLARRAIKCADTPLRRAQVIAWAELPALACLGRRDEVRDAAKTAQREMDAAPESDEPGRFGFDVAEFALHLAEAELILGNATTAAAHAQISLDHTTVGRPSWAAAILTLARSEVQCGRPNQGAEFALHVLETIPAAMLRETSRQRLAGLDNYLTELGRPGTAAADLHECLRTLSPLRPVKSSQISK